MQIVLSNNRVIAHGENFLAMGGVVINTETGAKFDNATVAECDGCPSDIDKVGYEYVNGVFKPCAPYGTGNNNGFFMEVCETCATPRSSGIPIKGGIKNENLNDEVTASSLGGALFSLVWENPNPSSNFSAQTVTLDRNGVLFFVVTTTDGNETVILSNTCRAEAMFYSTTNTKNYSYRRAYVDDSGISFDEGMFVANNSATVSNAAFKPSKIYAVKF